MIDRLRIFVFDYWHYLLLGIFALVVILSVMYFNRQQYEKRRERMANVSMDRVRLVGETRPAAEPDSPVNGMLLPPLSVFQPLPADWPIREEWGEPVTVMERRIPDVSLFEAPSLSGPDVTPPQ